MLPKNYLNNFVAVYTFISSKIERIFNHKGFFKNVVNTNKEIEAF